MDKESIKTELAELKGIVANLATVVEKAAKGVQTKNADGITTPVTGKPMVEIMDVHQGKALNFCRSLRALAYSRKHNVDYEKAGKEFKLPENTLMRLHEDSVEKALTDGELAGGGVLDPDRWSGEFIEILRPKMTILAAGVQDIPMDGQSLSIGRQSADITGAWVGESQNAPATAPAFDDIMLELKKFRALVAISNDLLRAKSISSTTADIIVRNSLIEQAKRALDIACLRGAGTKFTPRGVRNAVLAANVFASAAGAGSNTLTTALADLSKMQRVVEEGNVELVKPAVFFSPRTKWGLVQLRDGVGRPYWEKMLEEKRVAGVPFFDSTAIPNNLSGGGSGGSAESEITFIEALQWYLGIGMMPSIDVSREASYIDANGASQNAFSRDETLMAVTLRADLQPRHPEAGSVITGVTIS